MKRVCLLSLLFAVASGLALAQTRDPRYSPNRAAEPGVEVVNRRLLQAMINNDAATLDELLAEDWTSLDCFGDTLNKAGRLRAAKTGGTERAEVSTEGAQLRVYGVTAFLTGKVTYRTPGLTGRDKFINIYVRRQGRWRAVFSGISPEQPADPPLRRLDPRQIPYGEPPPRSPRP